MRNYSVLFPAATYMARAPVFKQQKSTGHTFSLDLALFMALTWYGPARSMQMLVKGRQGIINF